MLNKLMDRNYGKKTNIFNTGIFRNVWNDEEPPPSTAERLHFFKWKGNKQKINFWQGLGL